MQKRDFIQQAVLTFLPQTKNAETGKWDTALAIAMAEKLWDQLSQRGYGDPNKQGPRDIPRAYDQLAKYPIMKAAFDLFWAAFDYKQGRDRAAARWLQMGELPKQEYDRIVQAAKREAAQRKNLPEGRAAKMAEGWLTERRWLDGAETTTDQAQKQQSQREQQLRQINQDLAHAKRMADDTGDPYWIGEIEKLTEQLRQMRNAHD
ncbi:hypothetical protein NP603_13805 [Methylomonas sp. SURF-1]|uniref:Uncharacterized protein n=1 Tax=Methylomonas aurea TaxID=2952224 RepID=A0ABT1UIX1_9GAMM|nr:hypothetical protein [Methylomonas sp. SURF-1]MCQ8182192.1 hypothetical protein [Methylomonas sp. SURF-1]